MRKRQSKWRWWPNTKLASLNFTVRLQGAYPSCCHWPAVHSLLPSPPTWQEEGPCVRVSKGRGAHRPWKQAPKDLGDEFHHPKYQIALWWQHRFLKGTIPLGLTGEEGLQPEASQKRVSLNGWGQGKSLGLGLWLWMRLWVTKIKSKKALKWNSLVTEVLSEFSLYPTIRQYNMYSVLSKCLLNWTEKRKTTFPSYSTKVNRNSDPQSNGDLLSKQGYLWEWRETLSIKERFTPRHQAQTETVLAKLGHTTLALTPSQPGWCSFPSEKPFCHGCYIARPRPSWVSVKAQVWGSAGNRWYSWV